MDFEETPDYKKLKELLIEGLDMDDLDTEESFYSQSIRISNPRDNCLNIKLWVNL